MKSKEKFQEQERFKMSCFICGKTLIDQEIYVICTNCQKNICLDCFGAGLEKSNHKKYHTYVLHSYEDIETFEGWNPEEELRFLGIISDYGTSNWDLIGTLMRSKTPSQCELHFSELLHSKDLFNGDFDQFPHNSPPPKKIQPPPPQFQPDSVGNEIRFKENTCEFTLPLGYPIDNIAMNIGFLNVPEEENTQEVIDNKLKLLHQYDSIVQLRNSLDDRLQKDVDFKDYLNLPYGVDCDSVFSNIPKEYLPLTLFESPTLVDHYTKPLTVQEQLKEHFTRANEFAQEDCLHMDEAILMAEREELNSMSTNESTILKWNVDVPAYVQDPNYGNKFYQTLLSQHELDFCTREKLMPKTYLKYREDILVAYLQNPSLTKDDLSKVYRQTHLEMGCVYDFMKENSMFD